jgi:hypothetical protein
MLLFEPLTLSLLLLQTPLRCLPLLLLQPLLVLQSLLGGLAFKLYPALHLAFLRAWAKQLVQTRRLLLRNMRVGGRIAVSQTCRCRRNGIGCQRALCDASACSYERELLFGGALILDIRFARVIARDTARLIKRPLRRGNAFLTETGHYAETAHAEYISTLEHPPRRIE